MKLNCIKGNTYYIKGGTNTGIYKFKDGSVLLIDPGLLGMRPKKIINLLEENNLKLKYIINTHEHGDHFEGGIVLLESNPDIKVFSSEEAKVFIENPNFAADYSMGGKANEFLNLKLFNEKNKRIKVDEVIKEGSLELNGEQFEIIKLSGHTEGSIGILTSDKVLFVGDLFVASSMLSKFNLLLLYNVKEYLNSIEKIKDIDFEYMVIGHGKEIISKKAIDEVVKNHKESVFKYINQVMELLEDRITMDNILKNILNNNDLSCNYKEYHYYRSTIVSIMSYLIDLKKVDYEIKNGEILYYSKNV